jgi:hypothetical protein
MTTGLQSSEMKNIPYSTGITLSGFEGLAGRNRSAGKK